MKITLRVIGAMLILAGTVWFLQGINILPESFMTGQIQWAIYGGLAVFLGIGAVAWSVRGKGPGREPR
jgi:hypothetical protein